MCQYSCPFFRSIILMFAGSSDRDADELSLGINVTVPQCL